MRTFRSLSAFAVMVAASVFVLAPVASAAPSPFEHLDATCQGYGEVELTAPGADASYTPAFIGGTNQLLIPYEVTYTITVDGNVVDSAAFAKQAPLPEEAVACTFDTTFRSHGVVYHLAGEIVGVVEGQP